MHYASLGVSLDSPGPDTYTFYIFLQSMATKTASKPLKKTQDIHLVAL